MVLIVDDHPDTCRAIMLLLRTAGILSECVNDPEAALPLVRSMKPDLLVLDQMMPGLLGTEVLRAVRSTPTVADIPAIFYSAARDGEEEARRLGALDWLVKGKTDWKEVRAKIETAYRARATRRSGQGPTAHPGNPGPR